MDNRDNIHLNTNELQVSGCRNLIFTSAGDSSCWQMWNSPKREFDLFVCYYGDQAIDHSDDVAYFARRKGGKFPNLHYFYKTSPQIFEKYDYVLVSDDDVIISAKDLNRLFRYHKERNLWISQASFDKNGKVSWPITKQCAHSAIRYTSFVEVTCPLFEEKKLASFMQVYDPILVGWGAEWYFLEIIGNDNLRRVAIIDEICCLNPLDSEKLDGREIDRLQSTDQRRRTWETFKKANNLRMEERGIYLYAWEGSTGPFSRISMWLLRLAYFLRRVKQRLGL